jgi:hypothetical protein
MLTNYVAILTICFMLAFTLKMGTIYSPEFSVDFTGPHYVISHKTELEIIYVHNFDIFIYIYMPQGRGFNPDEVIGFFQIT